MPKLPRVSGGNHHPVPGVLGSGKEGITLLGRFLPTKIRHISHAYTILSHICQRHKVAIDQYTANVLVYQVKTKERGDTPPCFTPVRTV